MKKYDYLIVGAGLYGSVCAYELTKLGKKVLVIDKRSQIGGNCYTENRENINVHKYGAHIFHTSNTITWNYINQFAEFNNFINSPVAVYNNQVYNLPFNMNTFARIWPGVITVKDAKLRIEAEKCHYGVKTPKNLKEQAINLVGKTIFEMLVDGYTSKQWGKPCEALPPEIIKRLPVRFTYDNNYFNDTYQGIPIGGYTQIFEKMLAKADIKLNCDFKSHQKELEDLADTIIYTGPIDEYFDYSEGVLEYRSLKFVENTYDMENYQGNAVMNFTDVSVPYTRIIEHKHFEKSQSDKTIVSIEYPVKWQLGLERYYTINNKRNLDIYAKYQDKAKLLSNVIFGGRLAEYKYYDMDDTIEAAIMMLNKRGIIE